MRFNDFAEYEGNPFISIGEKKIEKNFLQIEDNSKTTHPKITNNSRE